MKTRLSRSSQSLVVVMVIGILAVALVWNLPFQTRAVPQLLGVLTFVLAAIALGRELLTQRKTQSHPAGEAEGQRARNRTRVILYLRAGAWLVGYVISVYVLGLLVTGGVFVLVYTKSHGTRWLTAVVTTIAATAFFYFVFEVWLFIQLYPGLLLTWLGR